MLIECALKQHRIYQHRLGDYPLNAVASGGGSTTSSSPKKTRTTCLKVQGWLEPSLVEAQPGDRYQFERLAYFCADKSSTKEKPVFNRTVELRDAWAKEKKKA